MVAEEREPRYALERSLHFALLSGTAFALLLAIIALRRVVVRTLAPLQALGEAASAIEPDGNPETLDVSGLPSRSEEHTSELQSLMRISSADFSLKDKRTITSPAIQLGQEHTESTSRMS